MVIHIFFLYIIYRCSLSLVLCRLFFWGKKMGRLNTLFVFVVFFCTTDSSDSTLDLLSLLIISDIFQTPTHMLCLSTTLLAKSTLRLVGRERTENEEQRRHYFLSFSFLHINVYTVCSSLFVSSSSITSCLSDVDVWTTLLDIVSPCTMLVNSFLFFFCSYTITTYEYPKKDEDNR